MHLQSTKKFWETQWKSKRFETELTVFFVS
jgi:hypothetical protein